MYMQIFFPFWIEAISGTFSQPLHTSCDLSPDNVPEMPKSREWKRTCTSREIAIHGS